MATKKTIVKKNTVARKTTTKTSSPAKKITKKSEDKVNVSRDLVEKKLSSVMDSSYGEESDNLMSKNQVVSGKRKKNSALWGVLALVLVIMFTGILLYEFNKDFKSNFNKLASSVGLMKAEPTSNNTTPAVSTDKFQLKLTVVYNKADEIQVSTINKYLSNIDSNLDNTKTDATWIDKNDAKGVELITKTDAKYLPLFLTDANVKKHPQYALFAPAIKDVNGEMVFQSEGMEYLKTPGVGSSRTRGGDVAKAKVLIIEYSSLTCSFCKIMQPILNKVVAANKGKVVVVTKHFDRGGIDSELAQSAECAGEQGKFDKMMDVIYERQADMFSAIQSATDPKIALDEQIKLSAKAAGVNGEKVLTCVKSGKYVDLIKRQTAEGVEFGVIGTPSMFVNKLFLGGALSELDFVKFIDAELKK